MLEVSMSGHRRVDAAPVASKPPAMRKVTVSPNASATAPQA
jgi:hypothetical protein